MKAEITKTITFLFFKKRKTKGVRKREKLTVTFLQIAAGAESNCRKPF